MSFCSDPDLERKALNGERLTHFIVEHFAG
jgi:hypothetical protein